MIPDSQAEPALLPPAEVARRWQVSVSTVRRLLAGRETRIGRQFRYASLDVLNFEEASRVESQASRRRDPAARSRVPASLAGSRAAALAILSDKSFGRRGGT